MSRPTVSSSKLYNVPHHRHLARAMNTMAVKSVDAENQYEAYQGAALRSVGMMPALGPVVPLSKQGACPPNNLLRTWIGTKESSLQEPDLHAFVGNPQVQARTPKSLPPPSPQAAPVEVPKPKLSPAFARSSRLPQVDLAPKPEETSQEWAARVVSTYPPKLKSASSERLEVRLPLAHADYYAALQKALSKRFPKESKRPTIDLTMQGSEKTPNITYGILGGVGCLADADLIEKTMACLQRQGTDLSEVQIKLHSNPHPPRSIWAFLKPSTYRYFRDVKRFLRQEGVDEYMVASNTAHKYHSRLRKWAHAPMSHMVNKIAQGLGTHQKKRVLVLGTSKAHKAKLYPKELQKWGHQICAIPSKEQATIQRAIQHIKTNRVEEGRHELLQSLNALAQQDAKARSAGPVTDVIMGCTEIPLAINEQDIQGIFTSKPKALDSNLAFADQIASRIALFVNKHRLRPEARQPLFLQ